MSVSTNSSAWKVASGQSLADIVEAFFEDVSRILGASVKAQKTVMEAKKPLAQYRIRLVVTDAGIYDFDIDVILAPSKNFFKVTHASMKNDRVTLEDMGSFPLNLNASAAEIAAAIEHRMVPEDLY